MTARRRRMGKSLIRSALERMCASGIAGLASLSVCACTTAPDFIGGYPPINPDLTVNVVIENPAGTSEKWEVAADGELVWERDHRGAPRRTNYLPWPANGGMIPQTYLDPELGGDGETLDVIVLGHSVERGRVVRAVVIGSIQIREALGRDDKILAVLADSDFEGVTDVDDLARRFPGVREILTTYYDNYVEPGVRETLGFGSRAAARRLIAECHRAYEIRSRSALNPIGTGRQPGARSGPGDAESVP